MGMAAEVEVGFATCRRFICLRGMSQEYLKSLVRDALAGTLGVICSVVMRIIHTNQPYALATAADFPGIVDEHYQAGLFQIHSHFNAVMVAQHAKNTVE